MWTLPDRRAQWQFQWQMFLYFLYRNVFIYINVFIFLYQLLLSTLQFHIFYRSAVFFLLSLFDWLTFFFQSVQTTLNECHQKRWFFFCISVQILFVLLHIIATYFQWYTFSDMIYNATGKLQHWHRQVARPDRKSQKQKQHTTNCLNCLKIMIHDSVTSFPSQIKWVWLD